MIFIALLRGINVRGHHKVKMADLKELLESIGLRKVKTYIQSGNVVLNPTRMPTRYGNGWSMN